MVPKINLIMELLCRDYYSTRAEQDPDFTYLPIVFGQNNAQCALPAVQSKIAMFTLTINLVSGLLSAFTSPRIGALSDRYGRTRMLMFTSCGALTGEIITIIAATNPETFPVNLLYIGSIVDGLAGSFIAGMAISNSYAADCTPPHKRNEAFGYFHGCLFTGVALGPLLSGAIVRYTGNLVTIFYVALGCHLFFMSCLAFVIPESLTRKRQLFAREKYAKEKAQNPKSVLSTLSPTQLFKPLKVLYPTGPGASPALRRNLLLLAAVDTTMFGVAMGAGSVVIIYSKNQFNWDVLDQSVFISSGSACRVICLFVLLPLASRWLRGPALRRASMPQQGCDKVDLTFIRTAVVFDTIGFLGYALVRTGPLFILFGCIASVGGIGSPTMQSALTKHLPHDRTGELLGASGLLHAMARIISPTLFNFIYSRTVGHFTQTVFVCLAICFGAAAVLSLFLKRGLYLEDDSAVMPGEEDEVEAEPGR